jgi:hypothetical protein
MSTKGPSYVSNKLGKELLNLSAEIIGTMFKTDGQE